MNVHNRVKPLKEIDYIVADNIAHFRRMRGLTARDLAQQSRISENTLNKIENKKQAAGRNSVHQLSKILNIEPQELYIRRPELQTLKHSPTLLDAIKLLSAYQNASDRTQQIVKVALNI